MGVLRAAGKDEQGGLALLLQASPDKRGLVGFSKAGSVDEALDALSHVFSTDARSKGPQLWASLKELLRERLENAAVSEPSPSRPAGRLGPDTAGVDTASMTGHMVFGSRPLSLESLGNFSSCRANVCVYAGKWQFEATVSTAGIQQVGWCNIRTPFTMEEGVGDAPDSYAFDGKRVRKWHVKPTPFGVAWAPGDVIGSCIDLEEGTISFYRNGRALGVAFRDVRTMRPNLAYFPAVSLSHGERCELNLGARPLDYPVPGYQPLQAAPLPSTQHTGALLVATLKRLVETAAASLGEEDDGSSRDNGDGTVDGGGSGRSSGSSSSREEGAGGALAGARSSVAALPWDQALLAASLLAPHLATALQQPYLVHSLLLPALLELHGSGTASDQLGVHRPRHVAAALQLLRLTLPHALFASCVALVVEELARRCVVSPLQPKQLPSTSAYPHIALLCTLVRDAAVRRLWLAHPHCYVLVEMAITRKPPSPDDLKELVPTVWWRGCSDAAAAADPAAAKERMRSSLAALARSITMAEDKQFELLTTLLIPDPPSPTLPPPASAAAAATQPPSLSTAGVATAAVSPLPPPATPPPPLGRSPSGSSSTSSPAASPSWPAAGGGGSPLRPARAAPLPLVAFYRHLLQKNRGANRDVPPPGLSDHSVLISAFFFLLRLLQPLLPAGAPLSQFPAADVFMRINDLQVNEDLPRLGGALSHLIREVRVSANCRTPVLLSEGAAATPSPTSSPSPLSVGGAAAQAAAEAAARRLPPSVLPELLHACLVLYQWRPAASLRSILTVTVAQANSAAGLDEVERHLTRLPSTSLSSAAAAAGASMSSAAAAAPAAAAAARAAPSSAGASAAPPSTPAAASTPGAGQTPGAASTTSSSPSTPPNSGIPSIAAALAAAAGFGGGGAAAGYPPAEHTQYLSEARNYFREDATSNARLGALMRVVFLGGWKRGALAALASYCGRLVTVLERRDALLSYVPTCYVDLIVDVVSVLAKGPGPTPSPDALPPAGADADAGVSGSASLLEGLPSLGHRPGRSGLQDVLAALVALMGSKHICYPDSRESVLNCISALLDQPACVAAWQADPDPALVDDLIAATLGLFDSKQLWQPAVAILSKLARGDGFCAPAAASAAAAAAANGGAAIGGGGLAAYQARLAALAAQPGWADTAPVRSFMHQLFNALGWALSEYSVIVADLHASIVGSHAAARGATLLSAAAASGGGAAPHPSPPPPRRGSVVEEQQQFRRAAVMLDLLVLMLRVLEFAAARLPSLFLGGSSSSSSSTSTEGSLAAATASVASSSTDAPHPLSGAASGGGSSSSGLNLTRLLELLEFVLSHFTVGADARKLAQLLQHIPTAPAITADLSRNSYRIERNQLPERANRAAVLAPVAGILVGLWGAAAARQAAGTAAINAAAAGSKQTKAQQLLVELLASKISTHEYLSHLKAVVWRSSGGSGSAAATGSGGTNSSSSDSRIAEVVAALRELVDAVEARRKEEAAEAAEAAAAAANAPDDFLDPITTALMADPVVLPDSKVTVDRSTIERHLLLQATDPFSRTELSLDMVKEDTALRARIEEWKAGGRATAAAAATRQQ